MRALAGPCPRDELVIGQFDHAGLLQAAVAPHGHGPPGRRFLPGLPVVVGVVPHGDAARVERLAALRFVETRAMKGDRHDNSPTAELHHAVVVEYEIAGRGDDQLRLGPRRRFVGGKSHVRAGVEPAIFLDVEEGEFAAGESQQRDAHHVVARGVFENDLRRAPRAPGVIGVNADDARGAFIRRATVKLGIVENDATRLEADEGAFGVARVFLRWFDVEHNLVFFGGDQPAAR